MSPRPYFLNLINSIVTLGLHCDFTPIQLWMWFIQNYDIIDKILFLAGLNTNLKIYTLAASLGISVPQPYICAFLRSQACDALGEHYQICLVPRLKWHQLLVVPSTERVCATCSICFKSKACSCLQLSCNHSCQPALYSNCIPSHIFSDRHSQFIYCFCVKY